MWIYIYLDPLGLKIYIETIAKFDTRFGYALNFILNPLLIIRFLSNTVYYLQHGPTIVQLLDSFLFRRVYWHRSKYYSHLVLVLLSILTIIFFNRIFLPLFTQWPTLKSILGCWCIFIIELRHYLACMISHYCLLAIWQLLKQLERQLDRYTSGMKNQ